MVLLPAISALPTQVWAAPSGQALAGGQQDVIPPAAAQFSPPLGFRDGQVYAPHVEYDAQGNLVEDTRFGVQNPDMVGQTCFGASWDQVYHAGEDLYRVDGASAVGAEVTAVADGTVVYANPNLDYPGLVVIIAHALASGRTIYSMYAHIDRDSLAVYAGQAVVRGQRLGKVMYQAYSGRSPARHPSGDDSHLHFEMRYFLDGRDIYGTAYSDCNGLVAGRGYTYPQRPVDFPAPGAGYADPASFIGGNS
jgi:murein DD-endopeptidase MepM/ murein hydrolase activator NlpD